MICGVSFEDAAEVGRAERFAGVRTPQRARQRFVAHRAAIAACSVEVNAHGGYEVVTVGYHKIVLYSAGVAYGGEFSEPFAPDFVFAVISVDESDRFAHGRGFTRANHSAEVGAGYFERPFVAVGTQPYRRDREKRPKYFVPKPHGRRFSAVKIDDHAFESFVVFYEHGFATAAVAVEYTLEALFRLIVAVAYADDARLVRELRGQKFVYRG